MTRFQAEFIFYLVSFMSKFKWSLDIFLDFSLISISMNLFDQLVIVICNPAMQGRAPSRNECVVLIFVCRLKCCFRQKTECIKLALLY